MTALYSGFQSALVLTLVVTLAINILFILDTSKKLHDENPKSPGKCNILYKLLNCIYSKVTW